MRNTQLHNSRGVALLAALLVLFVMSILGIGMLSNVDEDIKISKNEENSEKALKIAEAGIQIARSAFFDPSDKEVTDTQEVTSVNGFIFGGYFLAQLTSGFAGQEKWTQWRYDLGVTGNNTESEITAPLRRVWATGALGTNGSWSGTTFYTTNLYGVVATGVYFPIETEIGGSGDTKVRAHHEYTGQQDLGFWEDDKVLTGSNSVRYAVRMSPMATFSAYSGDNLTKQTLYFTYSGSTSAIQTTTTYKADTVSTVRLRAANAMNNDTSDNAPISTIWEFDTGLHGVGTAPALFDPDPSTTGDEIIYFAVISMGDHGNTTLPPGATNSKDLNDANKATDPRSFASFPSEATDAPEQIYFFAIVDTGSAPKMKWSRPFPDPDVAEWTDYPTEHVTGTNGMNSPYVRVPADMFPYLPEDDLLADYRDGPGVSGRYSGDGQWNQIRGNVFAEDYHAVSPPVVNILYKKSNGELTTDRAQADDEYDPIIDIYLMYANFSRVAYYRSIATSGDDVRHQYGQKVANLTGTTNWGNAGYRKPNANQTNVIAIRDQLSRNGTAWNWNSAKSRFPQFKWSYRVPGWDPNQTDTLPPHGYGEYSWNTWFSQSIAPMVRTTTRDQDGTTAWTSIPGTAGQDNLYTIIYPYYKSLGFPSGGGTINSEDTGRIGPTVAQGGSEDFSGQLWNDARMMMMAIRDTWDDYLDGNRTNIAGSNAANLALSNPVEPYWTYSATDESSGPVASDYTYPNGDTMITYNASYTDLSGNTVTSPFPSGVKEGFPRPYLWSESLWTANIEGAAADADWNMSSQGWVNAPYTAANEESGDIDIEGETAAICTTCVDGDGLIVLPFNHDLNNTSGTAREDLRVHGINATTGLHVWDYHMAASLDGDNANSTPAIANQKVFISYMMYDAEVNDNNRKAKITVLDANDGVEIFTGNIDEDADAVILPPTVANGMAYVGTYDFSGTKGASQTGDDYIRLFALSPMIRLVSTGIYPMEYRDYNTFQNHSSIMKDEDVDYGVQRIRSARRTLQVWINGQASRWEEVKENVVPYTP